MKKYTIKNSIDLDMMLEDIEQMEKVGKKTYTLVMLSKTRYPGGTWEAEFGMIGLKKESQLNELIAQEAIEISTTLPKEKNNGDTRK